MRIHWVMWEMAGAVTQAHALTCTQVRVPCSRTGEFSLRHLTPIQTATLSLTITILYWALVYKSGNAVQFSVRLLYLLSEL